MLRRNPELCLSIAQQPTTLYAIAALPASYCKCRLLPDKHMVHMIIQMAGNHSFTLTTGNNKRSRLQRLKDGVPQETVLVPLLSNIYTSDLLTTVSRNRVAESESQGVSFWGSRIFSDCGSPTESFFASHSCVEKSYTFLMKWHSFCETVPFFKKKIFFFQSHVSCCVLQFPLIATKLANFNCVFLFVQRIHTE